MVDFIGKNRCTVDACDSRKIRARGMCPKHYERFRKYGDSSHTAFPAMSRDIAEVLDLVGWTTTPMDCWEFNGAKQSFGYGTVMHDRVRYLAHRLAYETWVGPIPKGHVVRHKCDNPPCINPEHLETGTVADNVTDRVARGRNNSLRGEDHPGAKLTDEQVCEIRARYVPWVVSQQYLATEYGVSREHIRDIIAGRKR